MANLTWMKGGPSPNSAGRPKGSKADALARLKRWYNRRGTEKELDAIYNHLESAKEQADFFRSCWYYLLPRPQADSLSHDEAEVLYEKQIQLEQRNKQLEHELKHLRDVGAERAI